MDIGYFKLPYKTEADRKLTDKILQQFYGMIVIEKRGSPTKLEASAGNHDDIVLSISQAVLGSKIIEFHNVSKSFEDIFFVLGIKKDPIKNPIKAPGNLKKV
jgi:hypothetical protein